MNLAVTIKNYGKIAANVLWRMFSGRFLFSFNCKIILQKTFPADQEFTFIQVGANDGVSNDFLYGFVSTRKAAGLVIEPVEEYYKQLVENYRKFPSIIPVNIAVHATEKCLTLFKVKQESLAQLPVWANGIASSNEAHHLNSGIGKEHMQTITVKADTLMNTVQAYDFSKYIHYLQIDVEGYDDEVVKQIDFKKLHPSIIRFEYMNLSEEQTVRTIRFLKRQGYYCYYEEIDVVAVKPREVVL